MFGTFRESTKAIVAYTKNQHQTKSPFYAQIKAADTRSYVLNWLKGISLEAQPGDTVSVWLFSLGNSEGLALGDPSKLIKATKEFRNGVQVNIAFSTCHSSKFARAYSKCPRNCHNTQCATEELPWAHHETGILRRRNSGFIQAMVSSLTEKWLANQGYYLAQQWNVANHKEYTRDQVQRKACNPEEVATSLTILALSREEGGRNGPLRMTQLSKKLAQSKATGRQEQSDMK
ncbi:hypothetical protein TWF481_010439 [Arthrobotrys musiformis]|uniref:Uncharacterized protein n=1 Tax=Arthrobotrys musiformis TaxID=47236 RepID=A0AAV9W0T9_9PEZI